MENHIIQSTSPYKPFSYASRFISCLDIVYFLDKLADKLTFCERKNIVTTADKLKRQGQ